MTVSSRPTSAKANSAFRQSILAYLSPGLRRCISRVEDWDKLEEIRMRAHRPLTACFAGEDHFIEVSGRRCMNPIHAYGVTWEDIQATWQLMTHGSLYAFEEEMKRGYITLPGGHRVGIAGKVILERGEVHLIRDIAGLNLRIARAVKGAAKDVVPRILSRPKHAVSVESTLLISPPQCGKTTMLRDLARIVSSGDPSLGLKAHKVVIIDERSEIAACHRGIPQHDVGPKTDVLDGCPKAEGALMALRALSPEVIVTDEIGRIEDVNALIEARNGGVCVMATAHGKDWEEVKKRPILQPLWESCVFGRVVVLSRRRGPGTVESVHCSS